MKYTNKLFSFLMLALLGIVSLISCSSTDDSEVGFDTDFKVSQQSLTFGQGGGTVNLYVRSTAAVTMTSDAAWCTTQSDASESNVTKKFSITVAPSDETDVRTCVIKVTDGQHSESVSVTQTASDYLVIKSHSALDMPCEGGKLDVVLASNGDYKVLIPESAYWIKQSDTRAVSEATLHFEIAANKGAARVAELSFSMGEATQALTITQAGYSSENMRDAKTIASSIYAGFNIGNTLEAIGGEQGWGNPMITEDLVKQIKAAGFNAIRLPCAWDQYIEDASTNKIKESWLNRVNEVVGYCINNDLYAIVNIHWDGGWLENNCTADKQEANNQKQRELWTQIANRLKDYDDHLIFAGCNEPNVENAEQMAVLLTYEQTFVDAVRATGGNNLQRCLIVQGPKTDIDKTDELMKTLPTDKVADRMMVEVHFYSPYQFCLMDKDESWSKMYYFWGAQNHVAGSDRNSDSKYEEDFVKSQFAKMKKDFVDKGYPVVLGEYGTTKRTLSENQEAHDKSRGYFAEVVTREAKNAGIAPFYWDTGSVILRRNGQVGDQYVLDGLMNGAKAGQYPF